MAQLVGVCVIGVSVLFVAYVLLIRLPYLILHQSFGLF